MRATRGIDGQLLGTLAGQGSQAAEEDVVDSVECTRFFQCHQVARLFNDAHD